MLNSTFIDIPNVSSICENDKIGIKYDKFGNTVQDLSGTEYEDSCAFYDDCESENEPTNTEGIEQFLNDFFL